MSNAFIAGMMSTKLFLKVAFATWGELIWTKQDTTPEHAPVHPVKVCPPPAVVIRLTLVPYSKG
jgi:hypothetical protein